MNSYPTTYRDLTGNAAIEAMELADVRGSFGLPDDCNAEMDAAFGYGAAADELTEREIDALFVEEMERRDREAREVFGGNGGGDDDRTPPAAGAIDPAALYAETARGFTDSQLVTAIDLADGRPDYLGLDERRRGLWLGAMTAEVLRRLDSRKAA